MKTISLFSGCGGMDIGAEESGAVITFSNDIDRDSCASLKDYFPNTTVQQGDIAEIDLFPTADMLIGGYPCQSFSLGGKRDPEKDPRTKLYLHFVRCLKQVKPKYFVAENVSGLKGLKGGAFFKEQFEEFEKQGYKVTAKLLNACDYGVPQIRKRLFIVGVHKDLDKTYIFPTPTHGKTEGLLPYSSHGEAIRDLPLWPEGEFYARPHDPEGHLSWYFMSRNRKKNWSDPSFTIVANWRHITLHPASQTMKLTWSNLADGFKQRWDFSGEYEHLEADPSRPILEEPRRLSWRECARIQTFPDNFAFTGKVESKFKQIGNAVPPMLAKAVIKPLVSGENLAETRRLAEDIGLREEVKQYSFW